MDAHLLTELLFFDFSDFAAAHVQRPHLHPHHQLDVVLSGQANVLAEDHEPLVAGPGDAWLIPPLVRHSFEYASGCRQGSFKFRLAPHYWSHFGNRFYRFRAPVALRTAIEKAGNRHRENALLEREQAIAVATLCLVECIAQRADAAQRFENRRLDATRAQLWILLERVEKQPFDNWTVARMASECYLSPDHFSRCFHRIFGQTPQTYLQAVRMRAAATELLRIPPRQIKEIAAEAGYATVFSFGRAFKQVFGMGPAAYRQATRES